MEINDRINRVEISSKINFHMIIPKKMNQIATAFIDRLRADAKFEEDEPNPFKVYETSEIFALAEKDKRERKILQTVNKKVDNKMTKVQEMRPHVKILTVNKQASFGMSYFYMSFINDILEELESRRVYNRDAIIDRFNKSEPDECYVANIVYAVAAKYPLSTSEVAGCGDILGQIKKANNKAFALHVTDAESVMTDVGITFISFLRAVADKLALYVWSSRMGIVHGKIDPHAVTYRMFLYIVNMLAYECNVPILHKDYISMMSGFVELHTQKVEKGAAKAKSHDVGKDAKPMESSEVKKQLDAIEEDEEQEEPEDDEEFD